MPIDPLFGDNTGIRDVKYPFRLTTKEREYLKEQAKRLGVRDVATLIRICIREQLKPPCS